MKTILFIIITTIIAAAIATVAFAEPLLCPEGSYNIGKEKGQPICKVEPTGCPYGDSIPLDSPKCAPPEQENVQVQNTVQTEYEQTPQNDILGK